MNENLFAVAVKLIIYKPCHASPMPSTVCLFATRRHH